jgi:hypothetical protein
VPRWIAVSYSTTHGEFKIALQIGDVPAQVFGPAAIAVEAWRFVPVTAAELVRSEFNQAVEWMRRELSARPPVKLFQVKVPQRPDGI